MAWDSGTITSATPHTQLSTKLKNLVGGSGVANWSFVENVPAGTGAGQTGSASYSVDVFKCSGTGTNANAAGIDFYVALKIPVTDGAVASTWYIMEGYLDIAGNPANADRGKIKRWCVVTSSTSAATPSTAPTGSGLWISDTYTTFNAATTAQHATPTANTSGFPYYIKLTNNMIYWTWMTTLQASYSHMGGLIDSITTVSDVMPLIGGNSDPGYSRIPSYTTGNTNGMWSARQRGWLNLTVNMTTNAANEQDLWQGGGVHVSRIMIGGRTAVATNWGNVGGIRGLMKSDFLCFGSGGSVAKGDTMVISGNTYTIIGGMADNSAGYVAVRAT